MSHILAIDQGTSSSRAILYDADGRAVASAQQTFEMSFPQAGWVEQDPEEIWRTVLATTQEVLGQASGPVTAIGITNQRETTLVWERATGQCIYPAIVWQDSRTAARCEAMRASDTGELAELIASQTGLLIDPYFSSTKLAWILDEVPGARQRAAAGELCFGTVDSYLIWRLTGGTSHVTDATNASRTQLFDIAVQAWSEQLLDYFDIPAAILPEVLDSAAAFGITAENVLGAAIPITGVAGDQQAALVGQGCFAQGQSKSTYGTGCFVMANTGAKIVRSQQQLLSTVAYRIGGQPTYALEGSIFVAGVGIKWLRDQLRLIDDAAETSAAYEACDGDSGGVYVVPALTGLGAPYWQPRAKGMITGLQLDTNRDQVITAALQAVAFQTQELLAAMAADGAVVEQLRIDGGMVVNDHLCQFLADLLNVPVQRPVDVETTALGAAILAGVGAGLHADLAAAGSAWRLDRAFEPAMTDVRRQELLQDYAGAVRQVLAGLPE